MVAGTSSSILSFPLFAAMFWLTSACTEPQPDPGSDSQEGAVPELRGDYLGQPLPGAEPEVFAPGFVTTDMYTRDVAMTPDGSELYFGVLLGSISAIMETHRGPDGVWSEPEVASFSRDSRFFNLEPHVSPDGSKILFLSTRVDDPTPEQLRNWSSQDIWVADRTESGWGEPYNLGAPVNTEHALSLIHISEPTRPPSTSRMPSSA